MPRGGALGAAFRDSVLFPELFAGFWKKAEMGRMGETSRVSLFRTGGSAVLSERIYVSSSGRTTLTRIADFLYFETLTRLGLLAGFWRR